MKNKITLLLIFTFLLSLFVCGCTSTSPSSNISKKEPVNTRTIIDAVGREVKIPETITSVVPLANALRMMCYADALDLVVGIELSETEQTLIKSYNWINYSSFKDLPIVGNGGSGGYTPYEEELVQLNPDVIICAYTTIDAENLQEKTGIPVVVIYSGTLFEEDYNTSLTIIGEVCNKQERCAEVTAYIKDAKKDLESRTINVSNEQNFTVYAGAVTYKGAHGIEGTYSNFPPFSVLHATDILDGTDFISKGIIIEKEKILTANPDFIFLDPYNISLVNKDYSENQNYYKELKAFQNENIYTLLGYNYYYTNIEIAIADCYYAGTILYPNEFSDIDAVKKAEEIFYFFLGSKTYYQDLLDAGLGFKKITLGEINE